MYYLPDPGTNRVSNFVYMYKIVMACVCGLLDADISVGNGQPHIDNIIDRNALFLEAVRRKTNF